MGSEISKRQKTEGFSKRLVGFEVVGRQIPRQGYPLYLKGKQAGVVTSGCMGPTVKKSIGLGYVDSASPVTKGLEVEIRGERIPCKIVKGPFYTGESLKRFQRKSK